MSRLLFYPSIAFSRLCVYSLQDTLLPVVSQHNHMTPATTNYVIRRCHVNISSSIQQPLNQDSEVQCPPAPSRLVILTTMTLRSFDSSPPLS
jgi:hypothetical protein